MTGNSVLLDSSVIVHHFRRASAFDKLAAYAELYVPQLALGELYYGAFKSARPAENFGKYGKIAAQLAQDGTPIPQMTSGSRPSRSNADCRWRQQTGTSSESTA